METNCEEGCIQHCTPLTSETEANRSETGNGFRSKPLASSQSGSLVGSHACDLMITVVVSKSKAVSRGIWMKRGCRGIHYTV